MNVITNIIIPEEDYLRLKAEAAKRRTSFSAIVREKVGVGTQKRSKAQIEKIMADVRKLAKENAKYFKGVDSVKIFREMRYEDK